MTSDKPHKNATADLYVGLMSGTSLDGVDAVLADFGTHPPRLIATHYLPYPRELPERLLDLQEKGFDELDGFYTLLVSNRDSFAVVRDAIACKPAVIAETDDWVAMASEYRAFVGLPGVEKAKIWEPEPEVVYAWRK